MMRDRAIALLIAVGALLPAGAAAQTPNTAEPPRTAWGDPDLQGVWDYSSITPMQRPKEYADRELLTEEEAAALEQKAVERDRAAAEAPVTRSEAGDKAGAASHSFLWGLELGTDVVEDRRTSRIVDPPNGRFPALTAAGAAEVQTRLGFSDDSPADDYTDRGWGDRCLPIHGMPINPLPYNSFVQIFQTPDHVAILGEAFRIWRIIPLDDRPHGGLRQWLGDTRGHWDRETLVVETTLFSNMLQQIGSGRNLRILVERFTRVGDGVIRYEYTVDDPVKWLSPWTAANSLRRTDQPIYEVACHEGNYALVTILRGARVLDGTPNEPSFEPGKICWDCEAHR